MGPGRATNGGQRKFLPSRRQCCPSSPPPPAPRAHRISLRNEQIFKKDLVSFAGKEEYVVKGGRDKYGLLPKAF